MSDDTELERLQAELAEARTNLVDNVNKVQREAATSGDDCDCVACLTLSLRAERDALKAATERVQAIHAPEQYHDELAPWCTYCNRDDNTRDDVVLWPCPTLVALDAPVAPSGETQAVIERIERLRDKWLAWPKDDMHYAAGLMLDRHLSGEASSVDTHPISVESPGNDGFRSEASGGGS